MRGGLYEKGGLALGAGLVFLRRLRRGTTDGDDDDNHARSDNNWPSPGGGGDQDSARRSGRNANGAPGAGVCLDTWLLAVDRSRLCVGTWQLGGATKAGRCVGRRSLGS